MRRVLLTITIIFLFHLSLIGQISNLYINEIVAGNTSGIQDEYGEFSDWFELYNSGISSINIKGYSLTDDPADSAKWVFQDLSLSPGQYIYIFASGQDVFNLPVIWSTVIDRGDQWKYTIPDESISTTWFTKEFDDTNWNNGDSGFGYGDGDDTTALPEGTISVYLRKSFTVDDVQNVASGVFHIDYDDAFVAYINGEEIKRANIGTPGIPVAYNETADNSDHEAAIYRGGHPDRYIIDNIRDFLVEGENVFAVEVHNAGSTSSDMTAIPFFTLGYKSFEGVPHTNETLDLPDSAIHTNFKLSRGGEFLGLFDPDGNVVDTISFGSQRSNISFGRDSNSPTVWGYFNEPTPGSINGNIAFDFSPDPDFSIRGGFYNGSQTIELSLEGSTASVYYTIDGTSPDKNSFLYTAPITLDSTTAIRASSIGDDEIPSVVITQTFFIDEPVNLPFISLVTDPDNLFSDERGIYITGTNGKRGSCDATIRNLNQDWERPVNLELYDKSGESCLNQIAGIKIFGGCSRTRFPIKSFSLFARSEYGKGSFQYQLFQDKEIYKFEAFILRSSADDQNLTMMRDAFAQGVQLEYMDIDNQAYRPAIVFINGVYWGIHNIREKINEHYIAGNYGAEPDDVNILQSNGSVVTGDAGEYRAMIDFVSNNNMNVSENYEYIKKKMDVRQYIDYQIANIYMAEHDWPGNNIKFWNANSLQHNKWRWITFDRDGSFRINRIEIDALALATATDAPGWPNPPWSTLLFRRMLTNEEFKNTFIQIFAYHMNTTFKTGRVYGVVDDFKARIEDEIPRHIERWGGKFDPDMNESWHPAPNFNSVEAWENNVAHFKEFARKRPSFAAQHVNQKFGLTGMVLLQIGIDNEADGMVKIYHKKIPDDGYSGNHFMDAPVVIRAVPYPGHEFSHWTYSDPDGQKTIDEAEIEIILEGATTLTAHFSNRIINNGPEVLINEINYNSHDTSNPGDWVELINNTSDFIDLSGWELKDEDDDHVYLFREGTELAPYEYVVVCESMDDFAAIFPDVDNRIGDLGFKFSNGGEVIRLYDNNGNLIDSVLYDDTSPWPEAPDGNGPSLELIHPDLDNDLPGSWTASTNFGTPGSMNHTITGLPFFKEESSGEISLHNNYPNPVNTSTTISYTLDKPGNVQVRIVNILGEEVGTIVNCRQDAHTYSLDFDASKLPNGVYLYILQVDNVFFQAKRMMVIH